VKRLVVKDLSVERGGRHVFEAVSFALSAGEALVVSGANGAGKSTLLRTLAGYIKPQAGTIHIEGGVEDAPPGELAHAVGHADALKPALTVAENITFWAGFMTGAPGNVDKALETFGLVDLAHVPARVLSAGQRRRLSLARLMAVRRPLWLLDEPTTAIDRASEAVLNEVMRMHLAQGGLVVAATHSPLGLTAPRTLHLGTAS
jgi:heme exporter protein A